MLASQLSMAVYATVKYDNTNILSLICFVRMDFQSNITSKVMPEM